MTSIRIGGIHNLHKLAPRVGENLTKDPGGISAKDTMLRMSWLTGTPDADDVWSRNQRELEANPPLISPRRMIANCRYEYELKYGRPPTNQELQEYMIRMYGKDVPRVV